MARPSVHDPITRSYAIDQIDDIEHLRAVAHRMWEAFRASHSQSAHIVAAVLGECAQCVQSITGDGEPCAQWEEWQRKVRDGFGSV